MGRENAKTTSDQPSDALDGNAADTSAAGFGPQKPFEYPRDAGVNAVQANDRRDAIGLRALLNENFEPGTADSDDTTEGDRTPSPSTSVPRRWGVRVAKTVVGLAILVAAGWLPAQRLFQMSSAEAVVNAPLITIRSPIDGNVEGAAPGMSDGLEVAARAPLVTVVNPRADRTQLSAALDRLDQLKAEQAARSAKLVPLKTVRSNLTIQVGQFRKNRARQLQALIAEADARIGGAIASADTAKRNVQRQQELRARGVTASAALETARDNATIADQTVKQYRAARQVLGVELDAIKQGTFLGDSYNDRPQSAQRLDEVVTQIASIQAEMAVSENQIKKVESTVVNARERYALESRAKLSAPVGGRVWQMLAAPGEHVAAGQALMNIVDCSRAVITAAVSSGVYDSLRTGTPTTFELRDGGKVLKGRVAALSGPASKAPALAIDPTALTRAPYRVQVSLDNTGADTCKIGQTGRLVFHPRAN